MKKRLQKKAEKIKQTAVKAAENMQETAEKVMDKVVEEAPVVAKTISSKTEEIMNLISAEDLDLTEYSDALVYRIIERITVLSKEEIRIRFIGGFEITHPLH